MSPLNKYWSSDKLGDRIAPRPTIRRLTFYLRVLKRLQMEGDTVVSCTRLKDLLGFDSTQIRKDLSVTGIPGKPKVGYQLAQLIKAVERYLGWDTPNPSVLVGVGSLGRALLGYSALSEMAHLNILAAFDKSSKIVGTQVYNITVRDITDLADYVRENEVVMGIIAVPEGSAQPVADILVQAGVGCLWNFAPSSLDVPENIILENVDMSISLAMLTSRMANRRPSIRGKQ